MPPLKPIPAPAKATSLPIPLNIENPYKRETVESVIVAFILAFLFRAFVAEAFVIPTGSMAPTLMGAHKDLFCKESGVQYQVGASQEYDTNTGRLTGNYVVGSNSSLCRAINPIDFSDSNHSTFSGDRILVSKFDYVFSTPQRWDVLVFKYPGGARQNFIKRLVGLPNEQLLIQEGDVYVRKSDEEPWSIARKPPQKALAMRQPVSDTNYLSKSLVALGYPSLWQPWALEAGDTGWLVEQDAKGWRAQLSATPKASWLRYYHKDIDEKEWVDVLDRKRLPNTAPTDSNLVTDYLAYNSFYLDRRPMDMTESELVHSATHAGFGMPWDGMHWVSDLTGEFEVELQSDSGKLLLQLCEFGILLEMTVDAQTGKATLQARDGAAPGQPVLDTFWSGESNLVADTPIKGKGSYHIALANVDEQIFAWVNHRLIQFNKPAEFDTHKIRHKSIRRPHWSKTDPLDAAPIAIGGNDLAMKVSRAQVFRDLYYIAIRGGINHEYGSNLQLIQSRIPEIAQTGMGEAPIVHHVFAHPELWDQTQLFECRSTAFFQLEDRQYFPMGDNSAQSSDARIWDAERYVEEKFLLGKALLVFWPHPWYSPIPYLPNFRRMGLIR